MKRLSLQILIALSLYLGLDFALRDFAMDQFVPFSTLQSAIVAGNQCLGIVGSSEMVSGYDENALKAAMAPKTPPCIANLSIGATDQDIWFMALREYRKSGRKLQSLVVPSRGLALIQEDVSAPGYYYGNKAAAFTWGTLGDFSVYFPHLSFYALDNFVRYLLYRQTSFAVYGAAIWGKVRKVEIAFNMNSKLGVAQLSTPDQPDKFHASAPQTPSPEASNSENKWELDRWTQQLLKLAAQDGTKVFFALLPSAAKDEDSYYASNEQRVLYAKFLSKSAGGHGGGLIDISRAPWVSDTLLPDGLHFSPEGARLVSQALGSALAHFGDAPSRDLTRIVPSTW